MYKKNYYGRTPLFNACQEGHVHLVKYLVEQRLDSKVSSGAWSGYK